MGFGFLGLFVGFGGFSNVGFG
ncbi:hypothetical protein AKJ16_DCAP20958, partial [Drosera capensis]